jgi:ABC-type branched-subunit amino acid transport system substrate-binding protein
VVEDDAGDPARLADRITGLAARCDLLLGPYSTQLLRAAVRALDDADVLLWNHGGSGDAAVAAAGSRRVVSLPAPASRYAEPYVRHLAALPERAPLRAVTGRGAFGRHVVDGAAAAARAAGLEVVEDEPAAGAWDLLSAGVFEDDAAAVRRALALPRPPRTVCSVAAGVRAFGPADRVLGIAQWFPGSGLAVEVGPTETEFVAEYRRTSGAEPDYPAVQAAAAAALAAHCAEQAGSTAPEALWRTAAALDTTTLLGRFRLDADGVQTGHETVLLRWTAGALARARNT